MTKNMTKMDAAQVLPQETLTVAQVKRGAVDVPAVLESLAAGFVITDRVQGAVMWDAALLTHYLVTADEIGKGKTFETAADYAKKIGKSQPYVSRLKVLGRAAVVHSIRKGSAEWRFLCTHADARPIREAVKGDDSAAVRAAIRSASAQVKEHGKITQGARTPAGEEPTSDPKPRATAQEKDAQEKRQPATTLGDVRELLRQVESAAKGMDSSEKVEKALRSLADSLQKRRETLTQTAQTA